MSNWIVSVFLVQLFNVILVGINKVKPKYRSVSLGFLHRFQLKTHHLMFQGVSIVLFKTILSKIVNNYYNLDKTMFFQNIRKTSSQTITLKKCDVGHLTFYVMKWYSFRITENRSQGWRKKDTMGRVPTLLKHNGRKNTITIR